MLYAGSGPQDYACLTKIKSITFKLERNINFHQIQIIFSVATDERKYMYNRGTITQGQFHSHINDYLPPTHTIYSNWNYWECKHFATDSL